MLLNLTNHPTALWQREQLYAAQSQWGQVVDVPFPSVPPDWDDTQLRQAANALVAQVLLLHPDAVLCQGEMTFAFLLVQLLEHQGLPVYAACSLRQSVERMQPNGSVVKTACFRFVRFRRYVFL